MSSSRTYQCLSCRIKSTLTQKTASVHRSFHASPTQHVRSPRGWRRPSQFLRPEDVNLSETQQAEVDSLRSSLEPYTAREKELLGKKYTKAQMEAIEKGEESVAAGDMLTQGRFRTDPMRIEYIDDFATVRPMVDRSLSGLENAPLAPGAQPIEEGEMERRGSKAAQSKADQKPVEPHILRLSQQTGMTISEIGALRTKTLVIHRVVNQTRMGKISSQYFLSIAGNERGMVGIGEGKAAEFEDGRRQSVMNAIRNMKPVPRYEDRTIFGDAEAKVGATVVQLSARPPGFGNRCQHLIFELSRAAGISDLAARTPRSRNKMNVVKAAFQALTNQRLPDDVARSRGRKLVDVRGVYYGGSVY